MAIGSEGRLELLVERVQHHTGRTCDASPPLEIPRVGRLRERRLSRLAELCRLPPLAADVLACLVVFAHDPHAHRPGARDWLDLATIAQLLELPPDERTELPSLFAPFAPLLSWGLVEVGGRGVRVVERVGRFLMGEESMLLTRRA